MIWNSGQGFSDWLTEVVDVEVSALLGVVHWEATSDVEHSRGHAFELGLMKDLLTAFNSLHMS